MKISILLIICLFITTMLQAQVSKTINVTAGGLYSGLTVAEKSSVTNLTVTGTIDASDFKTMRDYMPALVALDLSGTKIASYYGKLGTSPNTDVDTFYDSNTIPYLGLYKKQIISFSFPSAVTSIGMSAFSGCEKLSNITIPTSVTSIESIAFAECRMLTSVIIPTSVVSIKESAFIRCSGLTSITIPASIQSIESGVFAQCSALSNINIPSSVTSIGTSAFSSTGLKSIILPSSVKNIGMSAFSDCRFLTSVNIPSSVSTIEGNAFSGCTNLTSIYAYHLVPISLTRTDVFLNVNKNNCILYVPIGTVNSYRTANVWKEFNHVVEFIPTISTVVNSTEISLFPNPTTDGCRISGLNERSLLQLFDSKGKFILAKEINIDEYISLNSLSRGIYFVKVSSESKIFEGKVVKN